MSPEQSPTPKSEPDADDRIPIAVRAFVPPPERKKKQSSRPPASPSSWTLTFDTETTTDAAQQLRVGGYQLRHGDELDQAGMFFDPESLEPSETKLLQRFCAERRLQLRSVAEFIDEIFFGRAYDYRASIIGFNLPFDLSRLAIRHAPAKGKMMRGGFTLRLSPFKYRPAIQIRRLNARAAFIQFTLPPRRRDSRRDQRKRRPNVERRGSFVDLKTIAAALFSRSFSLASLADFLKTPLRKLSADEHGARLTQEYLEYLDRDVEVTWQCYCALRRKFDGLNLEETHLGKILSEASIGKAYFQQMRIKPFRDVQPDFPDELTGKIMSTYLGGRAEVRWRRTAKQVVHTDFVSMYPTTFALLGLWRFVIAKGMTWTDSTEATRKLVEEISFPLLQRPDTWNSLTTIVRVRPDKDILPVRAKYDGVSHTIGLNFLTSDQPLWFTLPDVITAKFSTGKTPEILEAVSFTPMEPQEGLQAVAIAGNPNYRVHPAKDEFFKRLIDLRSAVKIRMASAAGADKDALDAEQQALKILANSTSYGIFAEINVSETDEHEKRCLFGALGEGLTRETNKIEEPGRYFHPLVASLITGAARLMLATVEKLIFDSGLDWTFCDTDSVAIAKPEELAPDEFFSRAQSICDWFKPLNPYEAGGSILKIENANFKIETKQLKPLFCYCISAKRYVLYNIEITGKIIIRAASAHGLGHLMPPYDEAGAPKSIPAPAISLQELGVERWQYDVWHQIVRAELEGHPDQVDLGFHPALENSAVSRYGANTPALLRWFKRYNASRQLRNQVKPFNFLNSFFARPRSELSDVEQTAINKRGRPRKITAPKPIAPFERDTSIASRSAFDRETGLPVSSDALMTYREVLAQYHLKPESKFLNGDFTDRGRTERRHIIATRIEHVGKESNRLEEQYFTGRGEDAEVEYGGETSDFELDQRLRALCGVIGQRETARRLGISRGTLNRIVVSGAKAGSRRTRFAVDRSLAALEGTTRRKSAERGKIDIRSTERHMRWDERIENYVKVTGFPKSLFVSEDGRVVGTWIMGNDYRVKSGYYGGYPAGYLRRVRALFPEKKKILHLFSGQVDLAALPGDTVDINPALHPTFVDDAQTLEHVPLGDYDLILADPPYSVEDAERYQTTMVKRNSVMRALQRVAEGVHVVWLDQVLPMYRKDIFAIDAVIGMVKSTNHRFRVVTVFCRIAEAKDRSVAEQSVVASRPRGRPLGLS